jgi:phosphatidylinositol phospholipase C delta
VKSKFEHYKEKLKVGNHGHHRNVPSISRDHSSDPDDDSESAIDLNEDAPEKPISKSSSRNSSSSGVGLKSEPRVLHAWTLTRYVGFRDVCRTIMETAFLTTQLPLIVSLEVGCDLEQQEVMVQIMKEEWKGHLVDEAHPFCDPSIRLPNLDELKEKILVKVKKATEQPVGGNLKPTDTILSTSSNSLSPAQSHDAESGYSGSEDERNSKPRHKKRTKICESLSQLGIYTHSEHFASFSQPEARSPPHVFSINERDILDLHAADSEAMMGHNRDYFMRAYPAGRRIDSSNPDPSVFWRKGVQMVALNWQNWDEGTMLNEAMFADEAGWVLKPQPYLPEGSDRDVEGMRKVMDLKVTVYAAQHVPLPKDAKVEGFRPFVKLELHVDKPEGPPQEGGGRTKEGRWKLRTKYSKGVSPDWEGEVCEFVGVMGVVEELSFLRLVIFFSALLADLFTGNFRCPSNLFITTIVLFKLLLSFHFLSFLSYYLFHHCLLSSVHIL